MQRDPDATLHIGATQVTRALAPHYATEFSGFVQSGLTDALQQSGVMHPFTIKEGSLTSEKIPFISYPYEWCFSQYKAAALLTLTMQETALQYGACLKDAKADNVQWHGTTPCFMDHSSLTTLEEHKPWRAYRQFCEQFLAPLFLMSRQHPEAHIAMRGQADGVPLAQARSAMRLRDMASLGRMMHIYLHAGATSGASSHNGFSLTKHRALIDSLRSTVLGLATPKHHSRWENYGNDMPYSTAAQQDKQQQVTTWLNTTTPALLWDIGAHEGDYAARNTHGYSVAIDADIAAVESCFAQHTNQTTLLPIWMDINSPSSAGGFAHQEQLSLAQRGKADGVLALAITHHLRASGVSFAEMAAWLASICNHALVEFIPADDAQAAAMLAARNCPFDDYTEQGFMDAFSAHFTIESTHTIADSHRKLVSLACK